MEIKQSHEIANPEILKILEGCQCFIEEVEGEQEPDEYIEANIYCGTNTLDGNLHLCPSCISILKGILISQEKEVEFLLDPITSCKHYKNKDKYDYCSLCYEHIAERIEALKISNEDLRERIK